MHGSSVITVLETKRTPRLPEKAVAMVRETPGLFSELMFGLWHVEGAVRERAAEAVETITRDRPELLEPFQAELLGLMPEARPAAVRSRLALIAPRLRPNPADRDRLIGSLKGYLTDRSAAVRNDARQSLAALDAALQRSHGE